MTVVFPGLFDDGVARMVLVKQYPDSFTVLTTNMFGIRYVSNNYNVGREPLTLTMDFPWQQNRFPPGEYRWIPYLTISHEKIPAGLLRHLGPVMTDPQAFVRWPCKYEGGDFRIVAAD
ncbi:MAG: hypothetical protein Q9P14_08585 [candidate division KSB1 bacterium]|nr:hypothetical protein [candidate division KSB1 bacterium]MDQ7065263.1 hypothetical protein [candidate division KSB1 bacterium]